MGETLEPNPALLGYSDDRQVCLVSGSHSGKGTGFTVPNLCFWSGSCLVIDPKGENANVTACRRGQGSDYCIGLGQSVVILDPFGEMQLDGALRGRYNPLDAIDTWLARRLLRRKLKYRSTAVGTAMCTAACGRSIDRRTSAEQIRTGMRPIHRLERMSNFFIAIFGVHPKYSAASDRKPRIVRAVSGRASRRSRSVKSAADLYQAGLWPRAVGSALKRVDHLFSAIRDIEGEDGA